MHSITQSFYLNSRPWHSRNGASAPHGSLVGNALSDPEPSPLYQDMHFQHKPLGTPLQPQVWEATLSLILKTPAPGVRDRSRPTGTPVSATHATRHAAGDPAPMVYPTPATIQSPWAWPAADMECSDRGNEWKPAHHLCSPVTQPVTSLSMAAFLPRPQCWEAHRAHSTDHQPLWRKRGAIWVRREFRLAGETTGRLVWMITEKILFHLFEARMRISLWGQHVPNKGKQPIISTIQQKGTGLALVDFTSPSCCSNDSGSAQSSSL